MLAHLSSNIATVGALRFSAIDDAAAEAQTWRWWQRHALSCAQAAGEGPAPLAEAVCAMWSSRLVFTLDREALTAWFRRTVQTGLERVRGQGTCKAPQVSECDAAWRAPLSHDN